MKSITPFTILVYLLFTVSGSLYSIGEKTIQLDGEALRKIMDYNDGITQALQVRPAPVLVLSSAAGSSAETAGTESAVADLRLSFDEGRPALFQDSSDNYKILTSSSLTGVDNQHARAGSGAALFPGASQENYRLGRTTASGPLVIEVQNRGALFAPNNRINDFTIEFWMHPLNMENGEQVLLWTSALKIHATPHYAAQHIQCVSSKNRLSWSFVNFFKSPGGIQNLDIHINGVSAVVPKTWSHHLIRFDSISGMVEYVVNGTTESIEYATSTGHEGGEVYTPVTGEGGSFVLGGNFAGLMDEFKIYRGRVHSPVVRKYPARNGRIETRAIDLGDGNNGILKLEASGGTTSNEYRRGGRFRFADDSEMQFFLRCSDNPYRWNDPWRPVTPGADIAGTVQGRYVQLAIDFYPSAGGEASPYLEELRITYLPDDPPLPPSQLTAVAVDGGVQLHWKNSPNQNTQGYLVYYGTTSDDYFGENAAQGSSPVDVGKQTTAAINGLTNGTLYYFRVAAYSRKDSGGAALHAGEFSREVRARPLSF